MALLDAPRRHLATLCLTALTPLAARAQSSVRDIARTADRYLTALTNAHDFSGSVLVARNHRVLFRANYGFANRERHTAIGASTRFAIGSVTKTFVAAIAERLGRRGLFSPKDPVTRYLPEIGHGDSITIEQLLAHSSGIPDYYRFPEYRASHCRPMSEGEFLALVRERPLEFRPGTRSAYSNSGYYVLAALLERITGLTLERLVRRELLAPLGMTATGALSGTQHVAHLATGYDAGFPPEHFQPAPCVDPTWLFGSASMYSTLTDLLTWAEFTARELQSEDSTARPHFGWGARSRFGGQMVEQNGRIPLGFVSYVGVWPADSVVVIALGNVQVDAIEGIGVALAAMALEQPYDAPRSPKIAVTLDSAELRAYAGAYEIAPGFLLDIAARPRGLELAGPDGTYIPLDTEGRGQFFFRTLYTPITFLRDSSGAVTALRWGTSFTASRVSGMPNDTHR